MKSLWCLKIRAHPLDRVSFLKMASARPPTQLFASWDSYREVYRGVRQPRVVDLGTAAKDPSLAFLVAILHT